MEEEKFTIKVINDCHPTKQPMRFELTLPHDATVKSLVDALIEKTLYTKETFELSNMKCTIDFDTDADLAVPLLKYYEKRKGPVLMHRSKQYKEMKEPMASSLYDTDAKLNPPAAKPETEHGPYSRAITPYTPSFSIGTTIQTYAHYYNTKSDTGFCGLSNQGATCYLNSLLQTLFMTPEFRSALYRWSFDDYCKRAFEKKIQALQDDNTNGAKKEGEDGVQEYSFDSYKMRTEELCIPRQLQKLFLLLNTSDKRACETKNLTKSFGWKQDDAFTQHDVQELCRVLFDALDIVWRDTEQAHLINELYQGEMQDYVQCITCGHESSRTDKYLDIPLVIKGFGATKAVRSIEEALANFIEPETLSGENQYFCERCSKKSDARKGLKLTQIPYLLTLQLKRFDFDFETSRRIKLNDRVTFPEILDMNPFLSSSGTGLKVLLDMEKKDEGDTDMEADDNVLEEMVPPGTSSEEIDKQIRQETIANYSKNGPFVYELFSVLIHRGSALGGHYFAYIKSFNTGKWYEFNDSLVREIRPDTIKETFGDEKKKKSSMGFAYGSNAYMLMYRQYDPTRNEVEPTTDTIPESIKKLIEEETRLEEEREQEKERQRSMITVKLYYKDQVLETKLPKTETLETVKNEAAKLFSLESFLPNNLRIRDLYYYYMIPKEPITDELLKKTLSDSVLSTRNIFIETKTDVEEFPKYDSKDTVIKVTCYDSSSDSWLPSELIWVDHKANVKQLKELLAKKYNIPPENQVLVKEDFSRASMLKDDEQGDKIDVNNIFSMEGHNKLCIEPKSDSIPRAFAQIDKIKNTITVYFNSVDSKEFDHKVIIDKRITVLDLKKIIEKEINLSIDEFKLFKYYSENYKYEIKNEEDKVGDGDQTRKMLVERGKPLRPGEIQINWILYDLESEIKKDLFQLALPGKLTIKEVKEELIKHWNELQTYHENNNSNNNSNENSNNNSNNKNIKDIVLPNDPSRLRLRQLYGIRPEMIFIDEKTLKESTQMRYQFTSDIYVQILPEGKTETKSSDEVVVIILRQFHPDKYELGIPWEFDAHKDEKLGDFRDRICQMTGISSLSLAKADQYNIQKILQIPHLKWYPKPEEEEDCVVHHPEKRVRTYIYQDVTYDPSCYVRSLNLSDGCIILYRDLGVPLKILTKEEEKKIKQEEEKKRQAMFTSYYNRKEERLDIKVTTDVDL